MDPPVRSLPWQAALARPRRRDVERFLSDLAVRRQVSASTQHQAEPALLFLYREVLTAPLPWLDEIVHARVDRRLPVVLTPREVKALLYGTGMRLLEGLRLRVKDGEFERREVGSGRQRPQDRSPCCRRT